MTCKRTRYKNRVDELQRAKNRRKSSVRAKVEHPFRILERIFGFDPVQVSQEPPSGSKSTHTSHKTPADSFTTYLYRGSLKTPSKIAVNPFFLLGTWQAWLLGKSRHHSDSCHRYK